MHYKGSFLWSETSSSGNKYRIINYQTVGDTVIEISVTFQGNGKSYQLVTYLLLALSAVGGINNCADKDTAL